MILSFKEKFVPLILNGKKIHTIRYDSNNRWKPGRTIHFATGIRTKKYRQFHQSKCTGVQDIELLNAGDEIIIVIDYVVVVNNDLLNRIANNDGLNKEDFIKWFIPKQKDVFIGKIIHWTDFKYDPKVIF